ncbi:hypothetical protein D5086_014720 [Populus alba]|uniref:Uncharacterized protein n=1 Tax=Populus alba TaxID=43335 RepID=A0ACC4BZT2_POPAL
MKRVFARSEKMGPHKQHLLLRHCILLIPNSSINNYLDPLFYYSAFSDRSTLMKTVLVISDNIGQLLQKFCTSSQFPLSIKPGIKKWDKENFK